MSEAMYQQAQAQGQQGPSSDSADDVVDADFTKKD